MRDLEVLGAIRSLGGEVSYSDLVKALKLRVGERRKLDRSLKRLLRDQRIGRLVYRARSPPLVRYRSLNRPDKPLEEKFLTYLFPATLDYMHDLPSAMPAQDRFQRTAHLLRRLADSLESPEFTKGWLRWLGPSDAAGRFDTK